MVLNGRIIQHHNDEYEVNHDTKTIRIAGDVLATGEKLIAHYIIDN